MGTGWIFLGIIILLLLSGWVYEFISERHDRRRYPPPGMLIQVHSHRLHLYCSGERRPGQPLVLLETGLGNGSFDWRLVQPVLAQAARVCSYDRAGYGWSKKSPAGISLRQKAVEFHDLLMAAGESGPYLMVGHSYGGILVREFAREFPEEIAGMVLVDSAHEAQIQRLPPNEVRQLSASLGIYGILEVLARVGVVRLLARPLLLVRFPSARTPEEKEILLTLVSRPDYYRAIRLESRALIKSRSQEFSLPGMETMPLTVIQAAGQPERLPRGTSRAQWQASRRMFDAIQQELTGLSSRSELVRAERSLHAVQLEQPELVVEAIRNMLNLSDNIVDRPLTINDTHS